MSLIELIGFVISLLALIVLFVKRIREDRYRREHPEELEKEEQEQTEQLREFLRSIDMDMEEDKKLPPVRREAPNTKVNKRPEPEKSPVPTRPHRSVQDDFKFKTKVEERQLETKIEKRKMKTSIDERYKDPFGSRVVSVDLSLPQAADAYEVIRRSTRNRALNSLGALKSKKDMVILSEIIGKPKSLR